MNLKKILRYVISIFFIFAAITSIFELINWQKNKKEYTKIYVYKDVAGVYYENNNEKVYLKNIYDKNGEKIELNISENNITSMYSKKESPSDAIYLQNYNSDRIVEQPIVCIYLSMFALVVAYCVLPKKNNNKNINNPIINYYIIYLYIFLLGIGFLGTQIYDIINYNKLKNNNNVVIAYLDHEHKIEGKYAFEYSINGNKYIYSKKQLNDKEKVELYYNNKEPNIVYEKGKAINLLVLITGMILVIFTFPIIFFNKKMANRYKKATQNT